MYSSAAMAAGGVLVSVDDVRGFCFHSSPPMPRGVPSLSPCCRRLRGEFGIITLVLGLLSTSILVGGSTQNTCQCHLGLSVCCTRGCMASADPKMAQVTLKRGHDLRGKDMLPVIMRLTSLSEEEWAAKQFFASFSTRHALESYSASQLGSEFQGMTGYDIAVVLNMAHLSDSIGNRRAAYHCAIHQANLPSRAPPGTPMVEEGTKKDASVSSDTDKDHTQKGVKRPADELAPPPGISDIQRELKALRQEQERGNVQTQLNQVRTLAMRSSTPNEVLIAALENLYDVANVFQHSEAETFKLALKCCRENVESGKLHGLVTKLLGTEAAKKAQSAIEAQRKAEKKAMKDQKEEKEKDADKPLPPGHFMPSNPIPPFWAHNYGYRPQSRGRGRPLSRPPRQCFICRSPDHIMSACPHNTFKDKSS